MQEVLEKLNVDAAIITNPKDILYHTSFNGSFAIAILTKKDIYLITDPRYSHFKSNQCKVIISKELKKDIQEIAQKEKINKISFQNFEVKYSSYWNLKKFFKDCSFKKDDGLIGELRVIKTTKEIELLTKAQRLNEQTLKNSLPNLKVGITEKEFANIIKINALKLGAEGFSFEPIVAFGKNSANIHHSPTNKKLKQTEVVLIDMGVSLNGYQSDMSRTFLPKNPSKEQKQAYLKVLSSFKTGIQYSKEGTKIKELDKLSREPLSPDNFNHALGHGVGLEVHELPYISPKSKKSLKSNMVITIEPGLYYKDKFGIRIEDVVVVSQKSGKSISKFPTDISQVIWG